MVLIHGTASEQMSTEDSVAKLWCSVGWHVLNAFDSWWHSFYGDWWAHYWIVSWGTSALHGPVWVGLAIASLWSEVVSGDCLDTFSARWFWSHNLAGMWISMADLSENSFQFSYLEKGYILLVCSTSSLKLLYVCQSFLLSFDSPLNSLWVIFLSSKILSSVPITPEPKCAKVGREMMSLKEGRKEDSFQKGRGLG